MYLIQPSNTRHNTNRSKGAHVCAERIDEDHAAYGSGHNDADDVHPTSFLDIHSTKSMKRPLTIRPTARAPDPPSGKATQTGTAIDQVDAVQTQLRRRASRASDPTSSGR